MKKNAKVVLTIVIWFGVLFPLFGVLTSCSDPSQDVKPAIERSIVDGTPAQPEGQPHERGITIDTSR